MEWLLFINYDHLVAGALGGAVRWMVQKQAFKEGIQSAIVGAIGGTYLTPLFVPALSFLKERVVELSPNLEFLDGFTVPEHTQVFLTGFLAILIFTWINDLANCFLSKHSFGGEN